MQKRIKAENIFKLIYSYINEAKKLKIIKYNKNLQKSLNINIINYKYFPGKMIFELNGIGKEYNIDGFVKEKGKEYNEDGELVFEGEYLNGERNGEGKEYYKSNKLKFEGKYLNGKRNGKGKEYYFHDSTLFFDGEYLYGYKKSGKLFIEEHLEYELRFFV